MAASYRFTPRTPVVPNATLSATAYSLRNSKAKRPPIHNPYDKFTQPEFDAWIGDITGALKRALGQIEADDEPKLHERMQEVSTGNVPTGYRPIDLGESEDEDVNDSFAEIKARRTVGKGKARDPREGPGLGGADRTKPIEIISSDEEEENEVELDIGVDVDGSEEEEEDYSEHEEALVRRALPIPADAEFISIDDSDEEPGSEDQEPIKLEPLEVVEAEFHDLQHENVDEQNMELEQFSEADEIFKKDAAHMHQIIPLLADVPITTWPLSNSSDQQEGMSMDECESLYADIEAVTVQTREQTEVISTLVDWNYPPAFPAGIPTSAPGHLATPSSEESNGDVAVLDSEIDSPDLVDEESLSLPLVHEEVITQDLDKALAKYTETLVDHSIPTATLVKDSEQQSMSATLTAAPSFSLTFSDNPVNGIRIAVRDERAVVEKGAQERIIDEETIILEDVTELVNKNSVNGSVLAQRISEDIIDGEIESRDVDTSMQDTKIHLGESFTVGGANAGDDALSSVEGIDVQIDNQAQISASTSSVQISVPVYNSQHTYDCDQLPTPPPDQSLTALVANDGSSYCPTCLPIRHEVEIEEVQDEEDIGPQPFLADSAELDLQIDMEPEYVVIESESDDEHAHEDAGGEINFNVEIVSMSSASHMWDETRGKDGEMQWHMDYIVEEPLTDGRLTEEPGACAQSPGIVSFEPEDSKTGAMQDEPVLLDSGESSQVETNVQPQPPSDPGLEELTGGSGSPTSATHATPVLISSTIEHNVPMPITADTDVLDSMGCPDTPPHLSASLIPPVLDIQPQIQPQVQGDGLFTPVDESTTVAPARFSQGMNSQILDELARVFFETPTVSSAHQEEPVSVSNVDPLSEIGPVIDAIGAPQSVPLPIIGGEVTHISGAYTSDNIHATTSRDGPISVPNPPSPRGPPVLTHVALTRKPTDPILVSDPYPYSLSTPGVSLIDPTEEDNEQDNSMSSNSILEKDLEDKDTNSILDDADGIELQYPFEPDILAELGVPMVVEGENTSKIVEEVADADTDGNGDFNAVTRLPQSPVEAQPVADPPKLVTRNSIAARDSFDDVEKNDVSPREISTIDPAKGIPGDFSTADTVSHDLAEAFTTPPDEITGIHASARVSKRKRDSLEPTFDNVAAATVEKGKNKKERVSKLVGEQKVEATNQQVVNPRRKTPSLKSGASRAFSKKISEISSSSASATHKMLRPSSCASSVASSVPTDQSVAFVGLPSPTVHIPDVPSVQPLLQPISLFHAHGLKRNNQPSQAHTHPTQPSRPSIQRAISLPRINNFGSTTATSVTTATPHTVVTSPTLAASPANMKAVRSPAVRYAPPSSPLTRSHCRYHRISLPKEEGGPRICFLVPGCSLSDRRLMAAQEIEDHGDATHEDGLRMIRDIQSLNFDSYLIGILRQLVGLDILREQEVFYLPQPEVVRKTSRKERTAWFRGADSSYAGSPGFPSSIRSPASMKAPTSVADSTSTSFSAFRRRLDSEKGSVSALSDAEIEHSDGGLPNAKRTRSSPSAGTGPMGPKTQGKKRLRGRHSKQMDVDYRPEETHEDDSSDVKSSNSRKKFSKPRVKRKRSTSSEIPAKDDGDEGILKKVKMHMSVPMSDSLAAGNSTTA